MQIFPRHTLRARRVPPCNCSTNISRKANMIKKKNSSNKAKSPGNYHDSGLLVIHHARNWQKISTHATGRTVSYYCLNYWRSALTLERHLCKLSHPELRHTEAQQIKKKNKITANVLHDFKTSEDTSITKLLLQRRKNIQMPFLTRSTFFTLVINSTLSACSPGTMAWNP